MKLSKKGGSFMLIETQNLTKIYTTGETEVRALNDVSLAISRGEFVSIRTVGAKRSSISK